MTIGAILELFYPIVSLKAVLMIERLEDLKIALLKIPNFTIIQLMEKDIALNTNMIALHLILL
jgi:hypothetical protein